MMMLTIWNASEMLVLLHAKGRVKQNVALIDSISSLRARWDLVSTRQKIEFDLHAWRVSTRAIPSRTTRKGRYEMSPKIRKSLKKLVSATRKRTCQAKHCMDRIHFNPAGRVEFGLHAQENGIRSPRMEVSTRVISSRSTWGWGTVSSLPAHARKARLRVRGC